MGVLIGSTFSLIKRIPAKIELELGGDVVIPEFLNPRVVNGDGMKASECTKPNWKGGVLTLYKGYIPTTEWSRVPASVTATSTQPADSNGQTRRRQKLLHGTRGSYSDGPVYASRRLPSQPSLGDVAVLFNKILLPARGRVLQEILDVILKYLFQDTSNPARWCAANGLSLFSGTSSIASLSLKLRSDSVQSAPSHLPDAFASRSTIRYHLPSFEKLDLWGWVFVSSAKNLVELLQCCRDSLTSLGLSLISYDDMSQASENRGNFRSFFDTLPVFALHRSPSEAMSLAFLLLSGTFLAPKGPKRPPKARQKAKASAKPGRSTPTLFEGDGIEPRSGYLSLEDRHRRRQPTEQRANA
ncbi:hypothetical protein BDN71DRAFT_1497905 [Pleurotus eryngii]|uniref:Uncharacterized protein n=1 Tax=Pleurotus eryngii TaxID=5323 RepID=A0A9P5ZSV0_PLEER|nr:hypothetical protein BDN71DRAFT_1497905 [Pleurotus eryngii]